MTTDKPYGYCAWHSKDGFSLPVVGRSEEVPLSPLDVSQGWCIKLVRILDVAEWERLKKIEEWGQKVMAYWDLDSAKANCVIMEEKLTDEYDAIGKRQGGVMSRGSRDYRHYKIIPQRNMEWSCAVSYMLQSPKNITYCTDQNPYVGTRMYKIEDGVFWYRCKDWDKNGVFPKGHWAQVGVSGVCAKKFTALAYHQRKDCYCDALPPELEDEVCAEQNECVDEKDKVIAERFERIEKTLTKVLKKLS